MRLTGSLRRLHAVHLLLWQNQARERGRQKADTTGIPYFRNTDHGHGYKLTQIIKRKDTFDDHVIGY